MYEDYQTDPNSPLRSVDGVAIKTPSSFSVEIEDVSSANAGRTEDAVMHKETVTTLTKISCSWSGLTFEQAQGVLARFPKGREYFRVEYFDIELGGFTEKTFYVGNRTANMYSGVLKIWDNLAFSLIERGGEDYVLSHDSGSF